MAMRLVRFGNVELLPAPTLVMLTPRSMELATIDRALATPKLSHGEYRRPAHVPDVRRSTSRWGWSSPNDAPAVNAASAAPVWRKMKSKFGWRRLRRVRPRAAGRWSRTRLSDRPAPRDQPAAAESAAHGATSVRRRTTSRPAPTASPTSSPRRTTTTTSFGLVGLTAIDGSRVAIVGGVGCVGRDVDLARLAEADGAPNQDERTGRQDSAPNRVLHGVS